MAFEKGHSRVGGRQAGTPNKPRYDVAARLEAAGLDAVDELVKLLPQLDAMCRAKVLMGLLAYVAPKPTTEVSVKDGSQDDAAGGDTDWVRFLPTGALSEALRKAKQLQVLEAAGMAPATHGSDGTDEHLVAG